MRGLLKTKSPLNQFLLSVCIVIASFFIILLIGTMLMASIAGLDLATIGDTEKWKMGDARLIMVVRGLQVFQFIGLFVVPVWICTRLFSTNSREYLALKAPSNPGYWAVGVLLLIVALPFVNFLGQLNQQVQFPKGIEQWMQEQEADAARTMRLIFSRHTITDLLLNIILIAGLAAVGEELLFRGLAQRLLTKMFRNAHVGIIIAAFLFSAMHMQFYGFLPRFVLGILLGYIYWYSGSIWTAMLAHFIYDAVLVVLVYNNPASLDAENTLKLSNLALMAAVSFIAVAGLWTWMRKKSATRYDEVYADDAIPVKNHPF